MNELFVRGIDQGAFPLLLTILVLFSLGQDGFLFVPGVEVSREDQATDIDILAVCNGHLIAVECKDLQESCSTETAKQIIEQLTNLVQVAQDIDARIVILSALVNEYPSEFMKDLEKLQNQYPQLGIYLVLRTDLERGYITLGQEKHPVDLFNLIPRSSNIKMGLIEEPGGRRFASF